MWRLEVEAGDVSEILDERAVEAVEHDEPGERGVVRIRQTSEIDAGKTVVLPELEVGQMKDGYILAGHSDMKAQNGGGVKPAKSLRGAITPSVPGPRRFAANGAFCTLNFSVRLL